MHINMNVPATTRSVPRLLTTLVSVFCFASLPVVAESVDDAVVDKQRKALAAQAKSVGAGPQSPRDIDAFEGSNPRPTTLAPPSSDMNLCNIHFHRHAEHAGGDFTLYAGNGDGSGNHTGYKYAGELTVDELKPKREAVCASDDIGLQPGDTIELHYVYTNALVEPGPTLGSCLSDGIKNPQLRVEAQVYVLVNDKRAEDFRNLTKFVKKKGLYQAINIPNTTGYPVQYAGSTTGPGYNEKASPFSVTWSVRPKVKKVSVDSVGKWCNGNAFNETHAHGVRNLVVNPELLSKIQ